MIAKSSTAAYQASEPGRVDRRYWKTAQGLLILPSLVFFLAVYLYPLSRLVIWSFFDPGLTLRHYGQLLTESAYVVALQNTLEISFGVTFFCLVLGYPLAYLMINVSPRVRNALVAAVLIPFWTSILVRSFAWIIILGRNGLINQVLLELDFIDSPLSLIHNMIGVQVGTVHVLLPFMVLPLYGAMSRIDPSLALAARSLGASPLNAFLRVFLPLSVPGIFAGCVLVFLLAVGFYVTPAMLGGPGEITLAILIELMVTDLLNWGFGATLGVVLLTVVGALFIVFSSLTGTDRIGSMEAR